MAFVIVHSNTCECRFAKMPLLPNGEFVPAGRLTDPADTDKTPLSKKEAKECLGTQLFNAINAKPSPPQIFKANDLYTCCLIHGEIHSMGVCPYIRDVLSGGQDPLKFMTEICRIKECEDSPFPHDHRKCPYMKAVFVSMIPRGPDGKPMIPPPNLPRTQPPQHLLQPPSAVVDQVLQSQVQQLERNHQLYMQQLLRINQPQQIQLQVEAYLYP
ncbi:MAG: hypothetical protein EBU93_06310 [Chlamydiae bacterium]|nr:hypothetical protein [Chlamydiota bacterium]